MQFTKVILKKNVFINSTKTTNQACKICIAWNDERGYEVINQIIQLFKWMRINVVFDVIDIAGQNYQKNMQYGIDENNLTHLKETEILIHTDFDYSFFNKQKHINVEDYLDIALHNYFKIFVSKDKKCIKETEFLKQNKKYISNAEQINSAKNVFYSSVNSHEEYSLNDAEYDFYISFGSQYAIFCIKNFNKNSVKCFVINLLKSLQLKQQADFLETFSNLEDAINGLKRKNSNMLPISCITNFQSLPDVEYSDIKAEKYIKLESEENELVGKFKVCELVLAIKEKQIKIPDGYELYQIVSNKIEYYPNINFWNEIVINPTVILIKMIKQKL